MGSFLPPKLHSSLDGGKRILDRGAQGRNRGCVVSLGELADRATVADAARSSRRLRGDDHVGVVDELGDQIRVLGSTEAFHCFERLKE